MGALVIKRGVVTGLRLLNQRLKSDGKVVFYFTHFSKIVVTCCNFSLHHAKFAGCASALCNVFLMCVVGFSCLLLASGGFVRFLLS